MHVKAARLIRGARNPSGGGLLSGPCRADAPRQTTEQENHMAKRDHPPGLGDKPMDKVAEEQFRTRTAGQTPARSQNAPNAAAGPDHPQVNHPPRKPPGAEIEHPFRAGAGHAQAPVVKPDPKEKKDGRED